MVSIALGAMREALRRGFDAQWRVCAGAAFVVLALVSIEYDEVFAPKMSRISDTWSNVAGDFERRISSFTL